MIFPHTIVENWPLSNVSIGAAFQTYPTRKIFQLHTDQGDFVAKLDTDPSDPQTARDALYVFEYLAQRNFAHIPTLLPTRKRESFVDILGRRIYIMEYIPGSYLDLANPESWRELGRSAATLNAYTDYPFAHHVPVTAAIQELVESAAHYDFREQYLELVARLAVLERQQPLGLLHGELNSANCIQRPDGDIMILDWDAAGIGPILLEIGYPLITTFVSLNLHFHREPAVAFYQGYLGQRRLDAETKEQLFSAALYQALRYMRFADTQRRWERICYAVEHEDTLLSVIP